MISVVVPFYNAEQFIGRCCESLVTQRGDFEFILVDDYSTDNSYDIACDYACKDKRITVLKNKYKKGVSGARNTGIVYSDGEWITFLDADDEMLPNACDTFHRALLSGDANIYQLNHLRYYTSLDKTVMKYWNNGGDYDLTNLPDCWWGVWNKIFKADFLDDVRFDESINYGEDGLFVLECLAKDNHILHAHKDLTTTKHRFDNKQSLTKTKTHIDIIKQIHSYEKFLLKHKDRELCIVVVLEIHKLWDKVEEMYSPNS